MEEKQNFLEVPFNYSLCLNRQCAQAPTCLRQLAKQKISDSIQFWSIISPKYQNTHKGPCPYYRSCVKVRFARGFINILNNLPNKQTQRIIPLLINLFNQRTYYRIRKGERLLSPSEQKKVMSIFNICGVTGKQDFDAYVEDYEW